MRGRPEGISIPRGCLPGNNCHEIGDPEKIRGRSLVRSSSLLRELDRDAGVHTAGRHALQILQRRQRPRPLLAPRAGCAPGAYRAPAGESATAIATTAESARWATTARRLLHQSTPQQIHLAELRV